ncbi:hypothetical protein KSS87_000157 [Heliosperma pusillum]|nr:hypothetical protein KSS87_000157 [Heliosperma pusillum]
MENLGQGQVIGEIESVYLGSEKVEPFVGSVGGGFMVPMSGFTRLCKGLAAMLVSAHILVLLFPPLLSYLALIPARTIPFAWNLITAGYVEQTVYGVIVSVLGVLFIGKHLEPIWGPKEFLKFIFVVNFLTSVFVFITAIALYYATRLETYLFYNVTVLTVDLLNINCQMLKWSICYMPISGFQGVLSGFLVGVKQIMPDHELSLFGVARLKAKWLPSLMIVLSITGSFFIPDSAAYLPMIMFGSYMSWIYLRFFQTKPETNYKGDPSDEFAFSNFFPEVLRPLVNPFSSIFHRLLCGRSATSDDANEYVLGGLPLPGSDPIEASRRRERGARALEERLTAERLADSKSVEEPRLNAADNV